MSDQEQTGSGQSAAERAGIVDQQDAALEAMEQMDAEEADEDPMEGEAPTG